MRALLIAVGVLFAVWLVFGVMNKNEMREELDTHNQKFEEIDQRFNSLDERYELQDGVLPEDNPIDEAEDELDMKEDEFDKKIEMPYEQNETNQNTNLKPNDDNQPELAPELPDTSKAEEIEKPEESEVPEQPKEEVIPEKNFPEKKPEANTQSNIVVFGNLDDTIFHPATEAFELDIFEEFADGSVNAFKAR